MTLGHRVLSTNKIIIYFRNMKVLYKTSLNCAGYCAAVISTLLNVFLSFLGRLILHFLHLLYTCYCVIETHVSSCKLRNVKILIKTLFKTDLIEQIDIKNRVSIFEKIPRHLAVIICDESPSYKDFVKLINWSIQAGIPHISFYQHYNGIDCEELFNYVCKDAKQLIPYIKWKKSFSEDIKEMSKTQINGYCWKPVISVHIYRREDGANMFLKAVPDIVDSGLKAVDVKELDAFLRKHLIAPDPDLALICGDTFSYFGFPPWCLRVTQFEQLTTHHNLTIEAFLDQLEAFSTCKQRWGK